MSGTEPKPGTARHRFAELLKRQVDKGVLPAGRAITKTRRDDFAAALGKGTTRAAEFYLTGHSAVHERDIWKLLDHLFSDDPGLARARAKLKRAWEEDSGIALRPSTPANIPRLVRNLIGRETDLRVVMDTLLAGSGSVAILVQGSPGIGKTELTKAVARQDEVVSQFGERRWFVPLELAMTAQAMRDAIVVALGCDPAQGFDAALANLQGRQTLLVLDNLETPWDPPAERVATEDTLAKLAVVPGISLLASFRGRDSVRGLDWVLVHPVPALEPPAAKELFCRVAGQRVQSDPVLKDFLRVLGGVPLAIELVAHRAHGKTRLAPLWAEWERIGVRLAEHPDFRDTRLTSLRHSIELSLLSIRLRPDALRLFRLLGVLPAGLSAADRDALIGDEGFDAEERLHRIGLAIERTDRIDLLPPIREHAQRFYPPNGDDISAWVDHFLEKAARGKLIGSSEGEGMAEQLEVEFGNIEAAFRGALHQNHRAKTLASLTGFGKLTYIRSITTPVFREIAMACRFEDDVKGEANCIFWLSDMALRRSDNDGARAAYEEALPLYRQVCDLQGEANCIFRLGDIALRRSDHDGARASYEEALPLYRRVGGVVGEAKVEYFARVYRRMHTGIEAHPVHLTADTLDLLNEADRISRDQEDIAAIWKRVEFAGCRLVTVSEGPISELQVGFTGTMSAVFLKNLADKTRRGQVGRVVAGRIPGGLCYGYEPDVQVLANGEIDRGRRRIVPEQADVVRRIFAWRAEGRSASFIVRQLNMDGEARLALRNLIELITVEPRAEGRGVDLLVHRRLAQILHIANDRPDLSQGGRMSNVVAGARSKADHTPDDQSDGCMKGLVAGAGYAPKRQRAPAGAHCMFGLVAGAGYGPKQQSAAGGADCMFGMVAGTGFEPVTFRL